MNNLVERLRIRAEIRRQIPTRKSVQENQPDRIADLLEEAADAIESRQWTSVQNKLPKPLYNVDVVIASLQNEEYRARQCNVHMREDGSFTFLRVHPAEYISHWMYPPAYPISED
jgi:hypothetical protein